MQPLPRGSQIVRTWFGDDSAWDALKTAIRTPSEDGFLASVDFVDDPAYASLDADSMPTLTPQDDDGAIVSFIADEQALTSTDWPLLAVRVLVTGDDDGAPFRVIASELWSVENNLNLANLDWQDFVDGADADRVFRGF